MSPLSNWEAAGIEGIGANGDLVAVEPAVAVAIRDSKVRAERRLVGVQQAITVRVHPCPAVRNQRVRSRGELRSVGNAIEVAVRTAGICSVDRCLVTV